MADYTGRDQRLKYLFQNGGGGGGSCKVISGYYHDGDFYEDQSYTQIITGDTECLYIDLDTTTLYLFDGTDYVEVQGGGGGAGGLAVTEEVLQATEITLTQWGNPLSFVFNISDYVGFGIEIPLNSQYNRKITYFVTAGQVEACDQSAGDKYLVIPPQNASGYTHNQLWLSYSNGTFYIRVSSGVNVTISRVTAIKKANKHTYSTTEQVVGTWIDGKPIYECVFDLGSDTSVSSTSWFSTGITIPSLSNILQVWSTNSAGTYYPLMAYHSGGNINIEACRDGNSASVRWLCLKYTKSTT